MNKMRVLITGANGEVGHGLVEQLRQRDVEIVALDMHQPDPTLAELVEEFIVADILDESILHRLENQAPFDVIFHMAALLSSSAERTPERAHRVNVQGTLNMIALANQHSQRRGEAVKVLFPSSIAVYGLPDLKHKADDYFVHEDQYPTPITMYGVTKLHCENLGRYYTEHFNRFNPDAVDGTVNIDFRSIRFPGLISASTLPSGGTSDYGPEMIHAAAQGKAYTSFVRPDTTIPFMMMPDAIKSLLLLMDAPRSALSRSAYNVTSFSVSAADIAERVHKFFPDAKIDYDEHPGRQKIVDSWPAGLDDSAARHDWGWSADLEVNAAFDDYLIPAILDHYQLRQNV